jgi:hypothetical protein
MKFAAAALLVLVSSVCFAQEDAGFGPPPESETAPLMIKLGRLYFYGPPSCIREDGEFQNSPMATVKLKHIRVTGNCTYVSGVGQEERFFYLAGPASFLSAKTRLKVMSHSPAIIQLEKGERFLITMEGEHDSFELVSEPPKDEDEIQEENNDGGNAPLFNPVPQSELPSAVQPRSILVPDPRDPAAIELEGTIEPLEPKPEKAPVRMNGPVAGEPKKKS